MPRYGCGMTATAETPKRGLRATSAIRLREDLFDARCGELGAKTEEDKAELCGTERTNLYRIRNGQSPSLELAMSMAGRLGVAVEDLFEQVA